MLKDERSSADTSNDASVRVCPSLRMHQIWEYTSHFLAPGFKYHKPSRGMGSVWRTFPSHPWGSLAFLIGSINYTYMLLQCLEKFWKVGKSEVEIMKHLQLFHMKLVQKISSQRSCPPLVTMFLNGLVLLTRIVLHQCLYAVCKKRVLKDLPLNRCCETLSC